MKTVLTDGRSMDIGGYKAVETGIILTEDEDRDEVIGFLPYNQLAYIVPDEVAERWGHGTEQRESPVSVDETRNQQTGWDHRPNVQPAAHDQVQQPQQSQPAAGEPRGQAVPAPAGVPRQGTPTDPRQNW